MKQALTWMTLAIVVLLYIAIVSIFGFEGPVSLAIHFIRLALTVSALVMFIPMAPTLFEEIPPPRIDRLFASIFFMLLSADCFSIWNESGRVFGTDPSVFTSPVAGLFSLFLIIGAAFALSLSAPDAIPTKKSKTILIIAAVTGVIVSVGIVFVAPLFR